MLIILQHNSSFTKHARVFLVAIDKDIFIARIIAVSTEGINTFTLCTWKLPYYALELINYLSHSKREKYRLVLNETSNAIILIHF